MVRGIILISILLWSGVASAATHYVGSGQTYATFAAFHAAITPSAGDIIDGGGGVFNEPIVINADGTAGSPIIYRNFTNKGTKTLGAWTGPDGNGEYSIAVPTDILGTTTADILIKDGVITNNAADNANGTLTAGYWTENTTTHMLYYKPDDGMTHVFEVGAGNLFDVAGNDYIALVDVTLYGGSNGVKSTTTDTDKVIGLLVQRSTLSNFYGHGVQVYSSDLMTVDNSRFEYCEKGGVKAGGLSYNVTTISEHATVRNSVFYRNGYANVAYAAEKHVVDIMPGSSNPLLENNLLISNGFVGGVAYTDTISAGAVVSVDGVDGVTLKRNIFEGNYQNCLNLGPDTNHASTGGMLTSNLFVGNGIAQVDSLSRANKLNTIDFSNGIAEVVDIATTLANNTFIGNTHDAEWDGGATDWRYNSMTLRISPANGLTGLILKNNLFYNNTTYGDIRIDTTRVTFVEDGNLYYRDAGGDYLALGERTSTDAALAATIYPATSNFAAYMAAVGATNDKNTDPILTSDYRLKTTSPARKSGETGLGITRDILNRPIDAAPDIGAYQSREMVWPWGYAYAP